METETHIETQKIWVHINFWSSVFLNRVSLRRKIQIIRIEEKNGNNHLSEPEIPNTGNRRHIILQILNLIPFHLDLTTNSLLALIDTKTNTLLTFLGSNKLSNRRDINWKQIIITGQTLEEIYEQLEPIMITEKIKGTKQGGE